jgi:hypothetical protein
MQHGLLDGESFVVKPSPPGLGRIALRGRRRSAHETQTVHQHIGQYTYFWDVVKALDELLVSRDHRNLPRVPQPAYTGRCTMGGRKL